MRTSAFKQPVEGIEMNVIKMDVDGVQVVVGKEVRATAGMTIRLGTIALRYIVEKDHGDSVMYDKVVVVANLDQLLEHLTSAGVRHEWERNLRYQLGINDTFRSTFAPEGTTDVFPVRLNPTNRLFDAGWKRDSADIHSELSRLTHHKERA